MTNVWIDDSDNSRPSDATGIPDGEWIEPMPVPVDSPQIRTRYTDRAVRPSSNFVAQLMAIDGGYPQTRDLNRAEPGQATAAYRGYGYTGSMAGRTQRTS
jgi:hypothetical protein